MRATIALAMFLASLAALQAQAAPLLQAGGAGVTLTLYDEPCTLTGLVRNLPGRVTWTTAAKHVYEGCYAINVFGIVSMFFADLTVLGLPSEAFRPVRTT